MTCKKNSLCADYAEQIAGLDTCAVSDAMDKLGKTGTALGISRMTTMRRIAGRVRTVQLGRAVATESRRHLAVGAIASSKSGDVIVVANGGDCSVAAWGGLLTNAARQRGIAGVVVDGAFRDLDECEQLEFPVFALSSCPTTARGRLAETGSDIAIVVSGVTVHPGDLVVADGTGVVFLPFEDAPQVMAEARKIMQNEAEMVAEIRADRSLGSVLGERYEGMLGTPVRKKPEQPS